MIQVDFKLIDSILEKYECQKTKVIPIMQDIQKEYKFLPKDALLYVADKVGESPAELYGIATFYENFSMNEKGKYVIRSATAPPAMSENPTMYRRLFTKQPV